MLREVDRLTNFVAAGLSQTNPAGLILPAWSGYSLLYRR